jgi:hypothetical protein
MPVSSHAKVTSWRLEEEVKEDIPNVILVGCEDEFLMCDLADVLAV